MGEKENEEKAGRERMSDPGMTDVAAVKMRSAGPRLSEHHHASFTSPAPL